jgi:transcriptional regulator with XRE-family HTH domain
LPFARVTLKCLKPKETDFQPQTLGEHIRKRRLELGLTQKDAARQLGCCWSALLNWEKGKRQPGIASIPAIIAFLDGDPFPQPTSLSEQLAAVRRRMGWSIKQTADRLGVDPGTWGRWEKTGIPWRRHQRIVAAFIRAQADRQAGDEKHADGSEASAKDELSPETSV